MSAIVSHINCFQNIEERYFHSISLLQSNIETGTKGLAQELSSVCIYLTRTYDLQMLQRQVIHSLPEITEKIRNDLYTHRKELAEMGPPTPKTQQEKVSLHLVNALNDLQDKLMLKELDNFLNAMVGASTIYSMYDSPASPISPNSKIEMAQKVYNTIYEECGKFMRDMKRPAPMVTSRKSESMYKHEVSLITFSAEILGR